MIFNLEFEFKKECCFELPPASAGGNILFIKLTLTNITRIKHLHSTNRNYEKLNCILRRRLWIVQ